MAAAFNKHAAGGDPCCGGGIEFERPYLVTLHDSTYSAYASRVGRLVPSVGSSPPTSEEPVAVPHHCRFDDIGNPPLPSQVREADSRREHGGAVWVAVPPFAQDRSRELDVNLSEHIAAERSDFLAMLETLSAEDFDMPSLCDGWSVRDVAAHAISYDCIHPLAYAAAFAASGFSIDRTNQRLVASWRRRNTEAIVEAFRRAPSPRNTMRLLGRRIALLDVFVHQQDIRRPLGRPRPIPADRLAVVAEILRHHRIGAGGATRAKGLRLEADDIDWAVGEGPVLRGPGEALVMALAGRATAVSDLAGDGKDELSKRMS